MKAPASIFVAALLVLSLSACGNGDEFATFEADTSADLPDCMSGQFPLELELRAAKNRVDRTGIFLQTTPDIQSRSDLVYFEIYQPEAITVDETIELGSPSVPPPVARGKLSFFSSCPYQSLSFDLYGTLRFDSFDYELHGIIAGQLEDGYAVDPRTGETMIEGITGSWNFIVRGGPPYEDFYAIPERPQPGDF